MPHCSGSHFLSYESMGLGWVGVHFLLSGRCTSRDPKLGKGQAGFWGDRLKRAKYSSHQLPWFSLWSFPWTGPFILIRGTLEFGNCPSPLTMLPHCTSCSSDLQRLSTMLVLTTYAPPPPGEGTGTLSLKGYFRICQRTFKIYIHFY